MRGLESRVACMQQWQQPQQQCQTAGSPGQAYTLPLAQWQTRDRILDGRLARERERAPILIFSNTHWLRVFLAARINGKSLGARPAGKARSNSYAATAADSQRHWHHDLASKSSHRRDTWKKNSEGKTREHKIYKMESVFFFCPYCMCIPKRNVTG